GEGATMQVACPRCRRVLDYSGDRPRFCAYCGNPLESQGDPGSGSGSGSDPRMMATAPYEPGASPPPGETAFERPEGGGAGEPERVAGYRIVRLLGRGGMGSVYEAEDDQHGRRVALKLIAADHVSSREAVERFRQEGRLASTIAHPRCVFVLAAEEDR